MSRFNKDWCAYPACHMLGNIYICTVQLFCLTLSPPLPPSYPRPGCQILSLLPYQSLSLVVQISSLHSPNSILDRIHPKPPISQVNFCQNTVRFLFLSTPKANLFVQLLYNLWSETWVTGLIMNVTETTWRAWVILNFCLVSKLFWIERENKRNLSKWKT